jgi:hypothetical protein
MIDITILTHFDVEDEECGGDYFDVEVLDSNRKVLASYGDYYHDKGEDKAEGFVEGLKAASKEPVNVIYKSVADRDEY